MRELAALVLTFIVICGIIAVFVIAGDVGDAINRSSVQRSLNTKQARNQDQEEWELKQAEREATAPARVQAMESFWHTFRIIGTVTITIVCIAGGMWIMGLSRAEVKRSNFEATQLKLDPVTRSYPILFFEAGGKLRMHDANTKTTLALEDNHDPNVLLTAYSTMVQMQALAENGQEINPEPLLQIAEGGGRS